MNWWKGLRCRLLGHDPYVLWNGNVQICRCRRCPEVWGSR